MAPTTAQSQSAKELRYDLEFVVVRAQAKAYATRGYLMEPMRVFWLRRKFSVRVGAKPK